MTAAQDGRQFARRVGETAGSPLVEKSRSSTPRSGWDDAEAFAFADGHGYEGPMPGAKAERGGDTFERYKAALLRTNSEARVNEILKNELFHNAVYYPNMNLQLRALYMRRAARCTQLFRGQRLSNPPEGYPRRNVPQAYPVSQPDAFSIFAHSDGRRRNVPACGSRTAQFRTGMDLLAREFNSQTEYGSGLKCDGTGELAMRNQFKAWASYMSGGM